MLLLLSQTFMQRLPRRSRVSREEERGEEGAALGHSGSTTHECGASRPAAVKYAGGAVAVTQRRRPLPAAPPGAFRARHRPRPATRYPPPASPRCPQDAGGTGVRSAQSLQSERRAPANCRQQVPEGGAAPVTSRHS